MAGPVVNVAEVQAWLETTKLNLGTTLPEDLESSEQAYVFGALSRVYDISGWTDRQSTPLLVRRVIAMRTAGWAYNRQYGQDIATGSESYGSLLLRTANGLLRDMVEGRVPLYDEVAVPTGKPKFFKSEPIHEMGRRF